MEVCGYRSGIVHDGSRPNRQNDGERPIAWSAWYPAASSGTSELASGHWFDMGHVIREADLSDNPLFPVALLSHSTGGSAESLGWLARARRPRLRGSRRNSPRKHRIRAPLLKKESCAGGTGRRTFRYCFRHRKQGASSRADSQLSAYLQSGFPAEVIPLWHRQGRGSRCTNLMHGERPTPSLKAAQGNSRMRRIIFPVS